jgi:hypothetical protein
LINRLPKAAVADFIRGGEPPATTEYAFMYAAALLLAGDQAGYDRYVNRQAQLHGDTDSKFTLYTLARMAALSQRPPVPPGRILQWASRAVQGEPRVAWVAHVKGLAALRAGDIETATVALQESEQFPWAQGRQLNEVALGLIDLRSGRAETARSRLDQARQTLDLPPTMQQSGGKILLLDWLEFQVLRPQIEGPIFDRVFPVDPFAL